MTIWRFGVALWFVASAGAAAAPPGPAIEVLFKPPTIAGMQLSPDGKKLIAIGWTRTTATLIRIDADTDESTIVFGPAAGRDAPLAARWVSNDRVAVSMLSGTWVFDLGAKSHALVGGRFIASVRPGDPDNEEVLVYEPRSRYRIRRVNVRTGEAVLTNFKIPGEPVRWVFDAQGIPRVVTTIDSAFWTDTTTFTHWYRATIDDPWQKLAEFSALADYWMPLYLMRDGKSLAVTSRDGRDTSAWFRFDLEQRRIVEMLAGHPTQDIAGVRFDDDDERFDVVFTQGMKPEIHWFDARGAALQRAVDAALPGHVNVLSGDPARRVLIYSYSDVDPGQWYLLDLPKMTMRRIGAARPEIDPKSMRPMEIVSYVSLDGLTIPAYLTRPAGDPAQPRPAVVYVHGGPYVRDRWQWDPEVQLLASRGYVVLQPQFRGSAGFGKRFLQAGFNQWGLAMQDDVTAGAVWLAAQGIADPKRICVYGASYGGYAAMWGLAKTPDLFRCGISVAGVSDIELMLRDDSDRNDSAYLRELQRAWIGDRKLNKQQFDTVSPLKQVQRIRAPVLVVHGERDARVPIEHSRKLVAALKREGKTYEWIELEGEGHGIVQAKNIKRFHEALIDFLDRHIGKEEPAGAAQDAAPTK